MNDAHVVYDSPFVDVAPFNEFGLSDFVVVGWVEGEPVVFHVACPETDMIVISEEAVDVEEELIESLTFKD